MDVIVIGREAAEDPRWLGLGDAQRASLPETSSRRVPGMSTGAARTATSNTVICWPMTVCVLPSTRAGARSRGDPVVEQTDRHLRSCRSSLLPRVSEKR